MTGCSVFSIFRRTELSGTFSRWSRRAARLGAGACLLFVPVAWAQRTQLKPGWNMFSPQQDVAIGEKAAKDATQQLPLCNDPKVDAYLTQLGKRLTAKAPTGGVQYPFEFHCVNDKSINAFALPGGFVFVNRGTIEVADNEAQLAGVMAHELSHVALRHGTNQASKAQFTQLGLGAIGAVLGDSNMGSVITHLGTFAAGSVLLKYSRTAETQADVMGTQILYDTGYDPRAMAQFFETLQAEGKGGAGKLAQFFSDHPNPDHRIERVEEEVDKLGGLPKDYRRDAPEFQAIKREVLALPAPPKAKAPGAGGKPAAPSKGFKSFQGTNFTLKYPDNWKQYGEGNAASFAPDGGVVQDRNAKAALAYGLIINVTDAQGDPNATDALEVSTGRLIEEIQHSNPGMRVVRKSERVRLNGQRALSTHLNSDSPMGGQETDWVITVMRPEGLLYIVCVAPEKETPAYDETFTAILDSVRFSH